MADIQPAELMPESTIKVSDQILVESKEKGMKRVDKLLIKNGLIVTIDGDDRIIRNGSIYIEDNIIKEIGPDLEIGDKPGATVIDATDKVVIPGLVQVHVHLNQTLFRGLADDMDVVDWLKRRIWPFEQAHTYDSVYASARLSILELMKSGTTTAVTMETLNHTEAAFFAAEEMGIRAVIGNVLMDRWEPGTEMKGENIQIALEKSRQLYESFHGRANNRIQYAFCPRGTRNATDELWQEVAQIAREKQIRVHSHAAENKAQTKRLSEFGGSEVNYLHKMGVLGPNLILAHAIWLTDQELELLTESGTHIAHCPSANFKLASGIAPVPAMLEREINVAVGADGAPCNNNLDAFMEMRLAALIHKPRFGPKSMPAGKVLEMMTMGGARAAGLDHEIGSLEPGKKADLVLINKNAAHAFPAFASNPVTRVVYEHQSRDVDVVIADGEILIQKGNSVNFDEEEILSQSEDALLRLLNRLPESLRSELTK